jgi:hypothetical protein
MSKPLSNIDRKLQPEESPIAWFAELLLAVDRGAYRRATECERELSRLGWSVVPRKLRKSKGGDA